MAQADAKSFDSPDETREFEGKGRSEVVNVGGQAVSRFVFEPGWRWSQNVKPIAGTDSCQVHHVGFCMSGRMKVYMDDGGELEIGPGEAYVIPPGHDAEVVGDENCVALEFAGAGEFAKR